MSGGTLRPSAECPGGHSARGDNPPSHTGVNFATYIDDSKCTSVASLCSMTLLNVMDNYCTVHW